MISKITAVTSVVAVLVGCSTESQKITAEYISPIQYQSYDCDQLAQESNRILVRVKQLGVRLDQAASNDKAIGVVGTIFFWPALFALGGTKQQEAEYARLKGEYDAVSQANILKKCGPPRSASASTASVDVDIDFAAVSNVDAVPYLDAHGREGYRDWVTKKAPKAFVLAPDGTWNATWGQPKNLGNESPDALSRALSRCEKRTHGCKAYAIDDRVVWVP
jgi:hypothetical protein